MAWTITIDQGYRYVRTESNVNLAIRRACEEHDKAAKSRQKNKLYGMRTIAQMSRVGGARIHATFSRSD